MKLTPPQLYDLVKKTFPYEGDWHYARMPENADLRKVMPNVVSDDDVRTSGKVFLQHLREMTRVFKYLAANKVLQDETRPWPKIPHFLVVQLGASYTDTVQTEVNRLIVDGTENQLGGFIAGTAAYMPAYISEEWAGCYARMLRAITVHEKRENTHSEDSNADDPCVATLNAHYWGFIGWIDSMYAAWQKRHNQLVDQTAIAPGGIMGVRIASRDKYAEQSICGAYLPLAKRPKVWLNLEEWKAEVARRKASGAGA
jgi:hypothetical protein